MKKTISEIVMILVMVIEVPELQGASLERLSGSDNHSVEV